MEIMKLEGAVITQQFKGGSRTKFLGPENVVPVNALIDQASTSVGDFFFKKVTLTLEFWRYSEVLELVRS